MYNCARAQDVGYEPVRAEARLRHCILRDGGGSDFGRCWEKPQAWEPNASSWLATSTWSWGWSKGRPVLLWNILWWDMMEEFGCCVASIWLSCSRSLGETCTWKRWRGTEKSGNSWTTLFLRGVQSLRHKFTME